MGKGRYPNDWVGDRSNGAGEGVRYGCWFSPCVGTGIFLPLGRSLVVRDRVHVEQAFPEVLLAVAASHKVLGIFLERSLRLVK